MGTVSNSPLPPPDPQLNPVADDSTTKKFKFNLSEGTQPEGAQRGRSPSTAPQRTASKRALLGRTLSQAIIGKKVGDNIRSTISTTMTEAEQSQAKIATEIVKIVVGMEHISGKTGLTPEKATVAVKAELATRLEVLSKPFKESSKAAKTAQKLLGFSNFLTGEKTAKNVSSVHVSAQEMMRSAEESIKGHIKNQLNNDMVYNKYFG